jgi:hypothetical protein
MPSRSHNWRKALLGAPDMDAEGLGRDSLFDAAAWLHEGGDTLIRYRVKHRSRLDEVQQVALFKVMGQGKGPRSAKLHVFGRDSVAQHAPKSHLKAPPKRQMRLKQAPAAGSEHPEQVFEQRRIWGNS